MSVDYRVRYKKGDIEVEVQSSDKGYVDGMIDKLLSMASHTHPPGKDRVGNFRKRRAGRESADSREAQGGEGIDAAAVKNKVHEARDVGKIEESILKKSSRLAKILLAFHFAHECGYEEITSGDVEKITDALGVKISQSSASQCIAEKRKLFSFGKTRRKGTINRYKLNLQGEQAYKKFLDGEKAE